MKRLPLVPMAAVMAVFYVMNACSGDEDTPAGSSGNGSGGTAAGTSGSAGKGAVGGTAGSGASVTTEECLASHFSDPAITPACEDCMCECNAAAASACDVNCWNLARCIQGACAGNMTDITCVTSMCMEFLAGATTALPASQCFTQCGSAACEEWFMAGNPSGGGAGAGGDAAGGAAGGAVDSAGMSNQGGAGGDGP